MKEITAKFKSYDGLVLEGTYHSPSGSLRGSILLIHGITSNRDEWGFYSELANRLENIGIASFRIDYRCHGIDKTPFEQLSLAGIVNDINAAFQKMIELNGNIKILRYIMGCSFGGGLSAFWAKKNPQKVSKIFMCYPVINYEKDILKTAGEWEDSLKKYGYLEYVGGRKITRPLINELPYINGEEAVINPPCKVVIIHGGIDSDVPVSLSKEYCAKSSNCELFVISGADHGFAVPGDLDLENPKSWENIEKAYEIILKQMQG